MKGLKVVGIIVLVMLLIVGGGVFYLSRGLKPGSTVVINEINPMEKKDGEYYGRYQAGRWTNEVKVTIKDQKITDISLVKDVLIPKVEVTEELFEKVIEKQSTKVDAVSGATVTSKAYLKSIEDALN